MNTFAIEQRLPRRTCYAPLACFLPYSSPPKLREPRKRRLRAPEAPSSSAHSTTFLLTPELLLRPLKFCRGIVVEEPRLQFVAEDRLNHVSYQYQPDRGRPQIVLAAVHVRRSRHGRIRLTKQINANVLSDLPP